ncbi:uncharacterized protein N7515_006413 [Penicillium bovifimosum]|uniref:N-acetylglucosamine-induced protein 1 n=1 Tax=Penicillium bovifimosum TaxID=126998 RepID=A0A9W9GW64_9EURO|nr:uncharacterized protein N7515_006413 [Penicillium bovifimosum]KAJ5130374.1 hypothetical protein N7515_006413 [Penicillium bovifimosum]
MLHHGSPSRPTIATFNTLTEVDADSVPIFREHSRTTESLPYWLVNIPRSQWTAECPSFLRDQSPKNVRGLSTPDHHYTRQDWELVKEIVRTNRIDRFQRVPSELRKYLEYMAHIKAEYGSVLRFMVKERLGWDDGNGKAVKPRGGPFEFEDDIKIIYNDWPYGVDKDIIHLVVWTKFELEDDPATGYLTTGAQAAIESYVQDTFCTRVPPEQVVWFKNWKSLKSVPGVEHFHVMLHRPDMEFVGEITRGDVPLIERL